jgi:rare lipoprotein A (peptidoglycan hydrolase)
MLRNRLCCAALASALAVGFALAAAPPSARAAVDPTFYDLPFGARDLQRGMNGTDVKTLNWSLRGVGLGALPHAAFDATTDGAVRQLQTASGLRASGVVDAYTRTAVAARMRDNRASWYGPGFWGNRTACGKKLRKTTVGVAHRKLPCGSRVVLAYGGRWVRAKVIDRGPYVNGRKWDLTQALAMRLGTVAAGDATVKAVVAR